MYIKLGIISGKFDQMHNKLGIISGKFDQMYIKLGIITGKFDQMYIKLGIISGKFIRCTSEVHQATYNLKKVRADVQCTLSYLTLDYYDRYKVADFGQLTISPYFSQTTFSPVVNISANNNPELADQSGNW